MPRHRPAPPSSSPRAPSPDAAVDRYIAGFPPDVRAKLHALRARVLEAAPAAAERIAYGIPTYTVGRNVFHFAAHKEHIGLYPGPQAIMAHAQQLEPFGTSKGAIRIPLDRELPLDLVARLIAFNLAAVAVPSKRPASKGAAVPRERPGRAPGATARRGDSSGDAS